MRGCFMCLHGLLALALTILRVSSLWIDASIYIVGSFVFSALHFLRSVGEQSAHILASAFVVRVYSSSRQFFWAARSLFALMCVCVCLYSLCFFPHFYSLADIVMDATLCFNLSCHEPHFFVRARGARLQNTLQCADSN